mmetsp:Transcript_1894/g.1338  ORF Transcript_1894/g.1338 Transcript_1894/m.1338 type:complete len:129 (+) Transcript_1894:82-468(+)
MNKTDALSQLKQLFEQISEEKEMGKAEFVSFMQDFTQSVQNMQQGLLKSVVEEREQKSIVKIFKEFSKQVQEATIQDIDVYMRFLIRLRNVRSMGEGLYMECLKISSSTMYKILNNDTLEQLKEKSLN